jgi:hypothetical protein
MVSGWFALSRRFRKQSEPYGETRSAGPWFSTVYTRFWIHYSGVIRFTAGEDALYLSVLFPFRIGHPPLQIPWNEIQLKHTRYFFRNYIELCMGCAEKIPFRVSPRMAQKLGLLVRMQKNIEVSTEPNFDTLSESFIESQRQKPD